MSPSTPGHGVCPGVQLITPSDTLLEKTDFLFSNMYDIFLVRDKILCLLPYLGAGIL